MNENLELNAELELQAWLDGELSGTRARRIEPKIVGDEDASRLVVELRSVKNALAGNEPARTLPESREFFWSKIEREIQRQTPGARVMDAPREAGWRRWFAPGAGFAALACLLLLALDPFAPPVLDEISPTGPGMEAVTFHDEAAGMTVVWLTDTTQAQPAPGRLESPRLTRNDGAPAPFLMRQFFILLLAGMAFAATDPPGRRPQAGGPADSRRQ